MKKTLLILAVATVAAYILIPKRKEKTSLEKAREALIAYVSANKEKVRKDRENMRSKSTGYDAASTLFT